MFAIVTQLQRPPLKQNTSINPCTSWHAACYNRVNGSLLDFNYQLSYYCYYYYYYYYCYCYYCYCYYYLFYFLIIFINLCGGVGTKTPVEWNSCLDCKSVIPLSFHRNRSSTVSFIRSPCDTERLTMSWTNCQLAEDATCPYQTPL